MKPSKIQGGNFADARGEVAFVNDFEFQNIKRFYTIVNSQENPLRAWQGHKLDEKHFFAHQVRSKFIMSKLIIGTAHPEI